MWSAQDNLVIRASVEGGGKLFAGDGIVWAEFAFAVARKDVVLCRPCDCVRIPLSGFYIGKAAFAFQRGAALHAPENCCHHAARRRPMRTEQGLARTEHPSIFIDEQYIAIEPDLCGSHGDQLSPLECQSSLQVPQKTLSPQE